MMSLNEAVAEKIVALHEGWLMGGLLIYRPGEPLSVTLRLLVSQSQSIDWELDYDLLSMGVDSQALLGPGRWKIRRYGEDVALVLPHGKGKAQILIRRFYVNKFLRRVRPAQLDIDSELKKLMEGE